MTSAAEYDDPFAGLSLMPEPGSNDEPLRSESSASTTIPILQASSVVRDPFAPLPQQEIFIQADSSVRDPFEPLPQSAPSQFDASLHSLTNPQVAGNNINIPIDFTRSTSTPPPPYQQAVVNVEALHQPLPTPPLPPQASSQPSGNSLFDDPPQSHDYFSRHSVEQLLRAELATERAKVAALERQLHGSDRNLRLAAAAQESNEELSHDVPRSNGRPAWYCRVCTLMNDDDLGRCGACGEQNPDRGDATIDENHASSSASAEAARSAPVLLRSPSVDDTCDCVVCLDAERSAVLVHDGDAHHVVCMDCAEILKRSRRPCPVCQRPIEDVLKYFS